MVLPHGKTNKKVPADSDHEHDEVDDDEDPLRRGWFHVTHNHVDVLFVRYTVIIRTHCGVSGVGPRRISRERFRVHWTRVLEIRDGSHGSVQPAVMTVR